MDKTSERTSIVISFRDLILYLCSRWRVILICMIIGAILGGAYSAFKSYKESVSAYNNKASLLLYDDMSDTDRAIVQNSITTFIHYLNQFEYYSEYNKKSIFQNLNPSTAKLGNLTYYIYDTDENKSTGSLVKVFENSIIDDCFIKDVENVFGVDAEEAFYYYDQIIRIGDDESQSTNQVSDSDNQTLLIRVYGEDTEFVEKMFDIIKSSVRRIEDSMSGGNGKYKINLVNETVKPNSGTYIYDQQEKNVTERDAIIKKSETLKKTLDGDILKAVENIIIEQYKGDYLDIIFPEMPESTEEGRSFHISKKWVLVGTAVFFIIACAAVIVKYLVKGAVRCYDDVEYAYGIQVLGTYDDPKTASKEHKTWLDRWIKSLRIKRKSQDRKESVALIAKKLQLLAKNHGVHNICVAIGPDVDTDESFMDDVAEKAEDISVSVTYDILRNADAINKVLEADGVILLEQMDKSRFSSIDQERLMCAGNNINILGVIIAE